ncbi:transcriptional regulator [Glycomyces tarimensis]
MAKIADGRPRRAVISGYLLKLARESIPQSQERIAEAIGADRTTIQSWESGKRPFTSVGYGIAIAIQQRLLAFGARPELIAALPAAVDADILLAAILDESPARVDLRHHPLGWTVLNHDVAEMLTWAIAGIAPRVSAALPPPGRRRGPVAERPELSAGESEAFFHNLRDLAERTTGREEHLVLHRQACFLSSLAPASGAAAWIRPSPKTLAHLRAGAGWSPYWADARSLAIALARVGEPDMLGDFITRTSGDEPCETANLNYWAYWVGEWSGRQPGDGFMIDSAMPWSGARLYAHLTSRLEPTSRVDLNVHSLWALLRVRPGLPADDPTSTARLLQQSAVLLDSNVLSPQARSELGSVRYALAMQGHKLTEEQQ